jgi:nicotinamide riboside kinase
MAGVVSQHASGLLICVTGPESTGKTTLAEALAERLGAPLVSECARTLLAARIRRDSAGTAGSGVDYGPQDVLEIAKAQLAAEQAALAEGAPIVVADTDLTVIRVWWEEKYGALHPWISAALAERSPRRYLLALPDIPWQPDPLRESPLDRQRLVVRYREVLAGDGHPFGEVSGAGPARLDSAWQHVRRWIERQQVPGPKPPAER